jgi:hypothetical protein
MAQELWGISISPDDEIKGATFCRKITDVTGSISAVNFTQMGGVVKLERSRADLGGSLWSQAMTLVNGSYRVQGSFSNGGGSA